MTIPLLLAHVTRLCPAYSARCNNATNITTGTCLDPEPVPPCDLTKCAEHATCLVTLADSDFESGLGGWSNAQGDKLSWQIAQGSTPSSNTGPVREGLRASIETAVIRTAACICCINLCAGCTPLISPTFASGPRPHVPARVLCRGQQHHPCLRSQPG